MTKDNSINEASRTSLHSVNGANELQVDEDEVEEDDDETTTSASLVLQLDELLLDLDCFDKPCRSEALERICKLAVEPLDPTARVVFAPDGEDDNDDNDEVENGDKKFGGGKVSSVQDALMKYATQSDTLFLHNFIEPCTISFSYTIPWHNYPPHHHHPSAPNTHSYTQQRKRSRITRTSSSNSTSSTSPSSRGGGGNSNSSGNNNNQSGSSNFMHNNSNNHSNTTYALKQLCLSHCTVNADTIRFLATALRDTLQVLILWNCTVRGLQHLSSSSTSSALRALVFVDCCIAQEMLEQLLINNGNNKKTSDVTTITTGTSRTESPGKHHQRQQRSSNNHSLQRLTLIRSGNLPNLQRRSSYYVSCPTNFARALQRNQSVKTLVLGDTMLPNVELATILMTECPHLQTLNLRHSLLSDTFCTALANGLTAQSPTYRSNLEALLLSQVRWSPSGAIVLADAIRTCCSRSSKEDNKDHYLPNLKRLDLSQTLWFGPHPVLALKQMLEESRTLEHLELNQLQYSSLLWSLGAVVEGIANNGSNDGNKDSNNFVKSCLKRVSLKGNHLDQDAMMGLTRILQHHSSLEELYLCECYYDNTTTATITTIANERNNDIDHGSNPTSSIGWGRALSGLAHNTRLKKLSLEGCRIGNVAAKAIGNILKTNTSLLSIDLCNNDIDDSAVPCLVKGLEQNQTLHRLFLHGNQITDDDIDIENHNHANDDNSDDNGNHADTNDDRGRDIVVDNGNNMEDDDDDDEDEEEDDDDDDEALDEGNIDNNNGNIGSHRKTGSARLLLETIRKSNHTLRIIFLPLSVYQEEMQYYGSINYAGRQHIGNLQIPIAVWPKILERASCQPDMIYYLLQHKPELFQMSSINNKNTVDNENEDSKMTPDELDCYSCSSSFLNDTSRTLDDFNNNNKNTTLAATSRQKRSFDELSF